MRKGTIFKHEFKRLLLSKEYLLLLAATFAYCMVLLKSTVLFGTNFTAPFSQLTFRTYCLALMPFLFILLLLLCAKQLKPSERKAEAIIDATPTPQHVVRLMRYSAIASVFLLCAAVPVASCFLFYRMVFGYTAVGPLLLLGILYLVAPAVLLFGIAMLLGTRKALAAYIALAVVLLIAVFQIAMSSSPNVLADIKVDDKLLTSAFITRQVAYAAAGMLCITLSLYLPLKKVCLMDR